MLNKENGNKRIGQLTYMLCCITDMDYESAEQLVVTTDIGKRILENDITIMYEQQTENLAEIASEFIGKQIHLDIASQLTEEKIVDAALKLNNYEKENNPDRKVIECFSFNKNNIDKNIFQKNLKQKRKKVLMIKRQNQMNARRIENANKFKK